MAGITNQLPARSGRFSIEIAFQRFSKPGPQRRQTSNTLSRKLRSPLGLNPNGPTTLFFEDLRANDERYVCRASLFKQDENEQSL